MDAAGTRARLDDLGTTVRREAEGAEADPFDNAVAAALTGVAEALTAGAGALADVEARLARLARRPLVAQ